MKRFIALLALAITVVCALPAVAYASGEVTQEMLSSADSVNGGVDNYVILRYVHDNKIWLIADSDTSCGKWEYGLYNGVWCLTAPSLRSVTAYYWSDSWVKRDVYESWNGYLDNSNGHTVHYEVLYASDDILWRNTMGELSGTIFFRVSPVLTDLAVILEKSTRQQSPMSQVVSLLPLLISLAVSFLALRKCLTTLSKLLRQG